MVILLKKLAFLLKICILKKLKLSDNIIAFVDDDDYDIVSQYNWRVIKTKHTNYVVRNITKNNKKIKIYLHREVLYKGIWDMDVINSLNKQMESSLDTIEGYVVRLSREYHYSEFRKVCGKYVRKNHVQNNHGHWSSQKIIKNELL